MTNGSLMKVESIAECSPSAILLTCIKRLLVLKTKFGLFESSRFTQVLLYAQIDKNNYYKVVNIFLFISLTFVLGAQKNCLIEYPRQIMFCGLVF